MVSGRRHTDNLERKARSGPA